MPVPYQERWPPLAGSEQGDRKMLRWFLAKDERRHAPQLKNLGKSLQNLRLFGVFPMERLTQALAVDEIKYIRQRETTSHLYFFLFWLNLEI